MNRRFASKRAVLLLGVSALSGVAASSSAQPRYPLDQVIRLTKQDVLIATITRVSTSEGTNENPPLIELRVHRVLSGKKRPKKIEAVWAPPARELPFRDDDGPSSLDEWWRTQPLYAAEVGARMILVGAGDPFRIHASGRYHWSKELEAEAIAAVHERRRDDRRKVAKAGKSLKPPPSTQPKEP